MLTDGEIGRGRRVDLLVYSSYGDYDAREACTFVLLI